MDDLITRLRREAEDYTDEGHLKDLLREAAIAVESLSSQLNDIYEDNFY